VIERRRVSFSADSLFTFDRSEVRPQGKAALDRFAQELIGTRFQTITVEGYTDRLGPVPYNQRLSQRRADAVKAYLVDVKGIDGAKISAVGNGMSAPVTRPDECRGEKRTPALIACLQPDRRVEIEVTGTQK
jgi:OOP family OmpA-OmpF porin